MAVEGNPARGQLIHPETRARESVQLNQWLEQLVSRQGSDLLLVPWAPAAIRVEGNLFAIGERPLSGEEIEAAVLPILADHAREDYQQSRIAGSSDRVQGLGGRRGELLRHG